jgi:hypothetical protein
MAKKLSFGNKPRPANADEWVEGSAARPTPPAPAPASVEAPAPAETPPARRTARAAKGGLKRLTIDLDKDLHTRIKIACTKRGTSMVEEISKVLEEKFPA